MNWIESLYTFKEKDPYSQFGEGKILEKIVGSIYGSNSKRFLDIGCGVNDELSNTRYLQDIGWTGQKLDKVHGDFVTVENVLKYIEFKPHLEVLSIDIDGNDYHILSEILRWISPTVIVAEFNAHYTDSRTIKYDPKFEWGRDTYYGFTFEAGIKLAERSGYKVIFQNDNLNMYFVRKHLVEVSIPEIKYDKIEAFPKSERSDWVFV